MALMDRILVQLVLSRHWRRAGRYTCNGIAPENIESLMLILDC